MNILNKILALTISIILVISLAACGDGDEKQNSKPNNDSKPTTSTTSDDKSPEQNNQPDNNSNQNEPENNTQNNNKPEENKPEPKPEPVKKTPAELIVGKWTAKNDISSALADAGLQISEPLEITLYTEFTAGGSLIEKADKEQMSSAMRVVFDKATRDALAEENKTIEEFEAAIGMTFDEYIDEMVNSFQDSYTVIGEYEFDDDILLVKFDRDKDFIETNYEFIDNNTLKITTDSEETIYTRVK